MANKSVVIRTFSLDFELIEEMKRLVKEGYVCSRSELGRHLLMDFFKYPPEELNFKLGTSHRNKTVSLAFTPKIYEVLDYYAKRYNIRNQSGFLRLIFARGLPRYQLMLKDPKAYADQFPVVPFDPDAHMVDWPFHHNHNPSKKKQEEANIEPNPILVKNKGKGPYKRLVLVDANKQFMCEVCGRAIYKAQSDDGHWYLPPTMCHQNIVTGETHFYHVQCKQKAYSDPEIREKVFQNG